MVQFLYGEDGMDGVAIEKQKIVHLRDSPADFAAKFVYDVSGHAPPDWLGPSALERITGETESARLILEEIDALKVRPCVACCTSIEHCLLLDDPVAGLSNSLHRSYAAILSLLCPLCSRRYLTLHANTAVGSPACRPCA